MEDLAAWKDLKTLISCTCREIWLERNCRVFDKVANMTPVVMKNIESEWNLWGLARQASVDDDMG